MDSSQVSTVGVDDAPRPTGTALEPLLGAGGTPAAVLTGDGKVLCTNRALRDLLGYAEGELEGRYFCSLHQAGGLYTMLKRLAALAAGADAVSGEEVCLLRTDGTTLWALRTIAAAPHAVSEPVRLVVQVQDVSPYKREIDRLAHHAEAAGAPSRLRRACPCGERA